MITFKKTILILIIITLASCGNYKNNRLPEGTIDKSEYTYPPEIIDYQKEQLISQNILIHQKKSRINIL